jgi:NTP pyrophosphatase (non-canonical NTP hydrolase)
MTYKQFWNWMNTIHSDAYFKAVDHYKEAAEIVLPPRLQKPLHEKANEIREKWDGMQEIKIDFSEFALDDIFILVQKEMNRATGIHGATFTDISQAKETIDEEYAEVWEAIEQGDLDHAQEEIIQTIGVLVKLIRFLGGTSQ